MTWLRAGLRELPGFIPPKNVPHPLLTDNSKQKRSNRAGVNGRERKEREGGYFQFQLHRWLKYSNFKISFHRKLARLKFNSRRADMRMCTLILVHIYLLKKGIRMQNSRERDNSTLQTHYECIFTGATNTDKTEVRHEDLAVEPKYSWGLSPGQGEGIGSLSKYPHT